MSSAQDIPVLTLDGPSGAGKGTVSRAIARQLGWHYLDSGAIYRSLAIAVLDRGIALDDVDAVVAVANAMDLAFDAGDPPKVLLDGVDISDRTGTETVGNAASKVAAIGPVRQALLQKQREFRQAPGLVADGRDMGTVVFPEAQYKVFLTASAEERARRRYKQLKEKGADVSLARLTTEIEERDRRDRERTEAPLKMVDGACFVDSSDLNIQQVIERCLALVRA
jgi:CMP/dCMP kinase